MGLGGLSPILSTILQSRRPCPGDNLPERATRFGILLFANFVPGSRRHDLDDVELSTFLWVEINAPVSNQPATSEPIFLAALSEPPGVSSKTRCSGRGD